MQFIPVPNVASVELIFDIFGQRCENVFHVKLSSSWTAADMAEAGSIFVDWFSAHGKQLMHSDCSLAKIVIRDLTSQNGLAAEYTTGLPIAGTITGSETMPLNVAACVSFGTNNRGRSYRGRTYQTGLTIAATNNNNLQTSYRNALVSAYGALITAVSGMPAALVVVSRYTNKAPRTAGIGTTITSVSVDPNIDSQRRRLTGRGQ